MTKYRPRLSGAIYMGPNDDIWFLKEVTFIFVSLRTVDDYKIQINIVYFMQMDVRKKSMNSYRMLEHVGCVYFTYISMDDLVYFHVIVQLLWAMCDPNDLIN